MRNFTPITALFSWSMSIIFLAIRTNRMSLFPWHGEWTKLCPTECALGVSGGGGFCGRNMQTSRPEQSCLPVWVGTTQACADLRRQREDKLTLLSLRGQSAPALGNQCSWFLAAWVSESSDPHWATPNFLLHQVVDVVPWDFLTTGSNFHSIH